MRAEMLKGQIEATSYDWQDKTKMAEQQFGRLE